MEARFHRDEQNTPLSKRRPNRSARQRREQAQRSQARWTLRFLKGLNSIGDHRGKRLGSLGEAILLTVKQHKEQSDNIVRRQCSYRPYMPICKHAIAGKCTWGEHCRFSHRGLTAYDAYDNYAYDGADDEDSALQEVGRPIGRHVSAAADDDSALLEVACPTGSHVSVSNNDDSALQEVGRPTGSHVSATNDDGIALQWAGCPTGSHVSAVDGDDSALLEVACPIGDKMPGTHSAEDDPSLRKGTKVQVVGLMARPELNGLVGVLEFFDEEKARWKVALDKGGSKLFKPTNLEAYDNNAERRAAYRQRARERRNKVREKALEGIDADETAERSYVSLWLDIERCRHLSTTTHELDGVT